MPLPAPDRRAIAARGSGLYERAAVITPAMAHAATSAPDPAALALLRSWNQAFAPGDEPALLRRLAWDGLDLPTVLAAAADPGPEMADPPWMLWLDRTADAARVVAAELIAGRFAPDPLPNLPFDEIWSAFMRAASWMLDPPPAAAMITENARAALERQLCLELTRHGELTLFEYFQRTAGIVDAPRAAHASGTRYRAFVINELEQGLAPFFLEYPALARQLAGITAAWVATTRELEDHLGADRAELTAMLGGDPGVVVSIAPGLSDPHHGRRRVAILQFASGQRLVYKPRSLHLDLAFNQVLAWMNAGLAAPLRILNVLDRGAHGWVEFAAHEPMPDRDHVSRYFERSGALMCLVSVLGAHDLHMENVVATSAGPVLVDTEMLLQPVARDATREDATVEPAADPALESTALDTGLLSLTDITPDGDVYDAGGLRGQTRGPLPFPARVWHGLRTDALHYIKEPGYTAGGGHEVQLGGVRQDPGDYREALLAGFNAAYRYLLDRRSELLSPGGPLAAFAGSVVRVVLRPTNQYAMLRVVLSAPRYQQYGVAGSTAVDVLQRRYAGAAMRPDLWEVAVAERRAIDRLDVPLFSVRADGTDLLGDGRTVVAGHFARSGVAAAIARVDALSERHLQEQTARIARALGESVTSRYGGAVPGGDGPEARALARATWIAAELLARADRTGDGLTWRYQIGDHSSAWSRHRLYDGTLGPAVFFAAMAAVSSDETWRRQALAALTPLEREISRGQPDLENIGGADGLGSIVYGLTVAGSLLGDRRWWALAGTVAAEIGPRIVASSPLDVVDGVAGAALALLGLVETSGNAEALTLARRCGDHLLAHGGRTGGGGSAAGTTSLVGFAHGIAGIANALARLYRATGDDRYRQGALRGWQFVADRFLPASGNYAIAAGPGATGGRRAMLAWCHGAPGVVSSLGPALDIWSETAMLSQVDAAVQATARDEPTQVEHICCGAMGRVDALLTLGRALGRSEWVNSAWRLADAVADRAVARGHFRLSSPGVEYRVFDPGFFRGLSGIGYVWLRLAAPARLPSIAGFEPARNLT